MNIVCIGAHPDDCEVHAGGTCVKWARLGHRVLFVSLTNGDIGHHEQTGPELAARRSQEARESAERGGVEALGLEFHDGELEATLAVRKEVVAIIRRWKADIVLTHRPHDYHPDHRYAAVATQDASFLVTVPKFCPDTPRLIRSPVFLYMEDSFTKPTPFQPDIAVDVGDVMATKWDMLDAMESQAYEWLPWLAGALDTVPRSPSERREWLREAWDERFRTISQATRAALAKRYGPEAAGQVEYAEAFEICEYGHQPSERELEQLFPFFPGKRA